MSDDAETRRLRGRIGRRDPDPSGPAALPSDELVARELNGALDAIEAVDGDEVDLDALIDAGDPGGLPPWAGVTLH